MMGGIVLLTVPSKNNWCVFMPVVLLGNLSHGTLASYAPDFKVVLLLVLVLVLMMASVGSFSANKNLKSVHKGKKVKEKGNKIFRAYNLEVMMSYFNLSLLNSSSYDCHSPVFSCALKADAIPTERKMSPCF